MKHALVMALVAGMVVGAGGCRGKRESRAQRPVGGGGAGAELNTGLAHQDSLIPAPLPKYDQAKLDQLAAESINLQAVLSGMPAPEPSAEPAPEPVEAPPVAAVEPVVPPVPAAEVVPSPAPPKPLAERVSETTVMLVDLLRQQAALSPSARAYLGLASLEVLHPGALGAVITPATIDGSMVSEVDKAAVESLRAYLAAVVKEGDAGALGAKMAEHAPLLTAQAPLKVSAVKLCREVLGFGQYTPLGTSTFVRGAPIRAVVYAEVEGFSYRELNEADRTSARVSGRDLGEGWAVEVSEELKLYHVSDDLVVWSRPEQSVVEMSRNKRRDFYLVQTVTLPATLSLGSYSLKVIVRDRNRGGVAEAIIPFDVVADPSLAAEIVR